MRVSIVLALLVALALPDAIAVAEPLPVILDTDGDADYDDVVAIMVAALSPELDPLGVVTTGANTTRRAQAVAKALAIVGRDDIRVYLGEAPLSPEPPFDYMSQFPRRLHDQRPELEKWAVDFAYERPAMSGVEFYLQQVSSHPGQVTVIVTGPLSTLGRAMQVADERGIGTSFRQGIRQVLFSGGDFVTAEYNVYSDVEAARLLFHSGVPIYQFLGEGEGKAYLRYADRQRLWSAQTPATWALQDFYRLWKAGHDPTSPFVPILYDAHPAAFLIQGETISRFAPATIDVDTVGHLVRVAGAPNAYVRVANRGDALVDFVIERVTARVPPAINHLRALRRLAGSAPRTLGTAIDTVVAQLSSGAVSEPGAVAALLDGLQPQLGTLGESAQWHLQMARGFLLGEPRSDAWNDPYTPRYIAFMMPVYQAAGVVSKGFRFLTQHRSIAAVLILTAVAALGLFARGVRRHRRTAPVPGAPPVRR